MASFLLLLSTSIRVCFTFSQQGKLNGFGNQTGIQIQPTK